MIIDGTHDPALKSWVTSANQPDCDFPIQNLPFAVFRRAGAGEELHCGAAIGDRIVDLRATHEAHLLPALTEEVSSACAAPDLGVLMGLGRGAWSSLRAALSEALCAGRGNVERFAGALVPLAEVEFALPARIGNYTDFYTSIQHATAQQDPTLHFDVGCFLRIVRRR